MTRPSWDALTPEQQRAEWERFQAWQATQIPAQRLGPPPASAQHRPLLALSENDQF